MCRGLIPGLFALLLSSSASAGTVTVDIDPAEGGDFAQALGIDITDLEMQLAAEIEQAFNIVQPGEYLTALVDAHSFSSKGLGADYASNVSSWVLGVGANISVATGEDTLSDDDADRPVVGVAPNISVLFGVNLGAFKSIDWPHVTVYTNFFSRGGTHEDLDAALTSFGLHGQYKFLARPQRDTSLLFRWGGFDVTTGIEYSRLTLEIGRDGIETELPVEGQSQNTFVTMTSTGTMKLSSSALSLPLELSTNWRVLYLLSMYVGAGVDLQLGRSDMNVNLDGELTAQDPVDGTEVDVGTVHVEAKDDAGPSVGRFRLLFGVQANLWKLRLFWQGNVRPTNAFGFAFGVRLVW